LSGVDAFFDFRSHTTHWQALRGNIGQNKKL
jgi:hypothetical protein